MGSEVIYAITFLSIHSFLMHEHLYNLVPGCFFFLSFLHFSWFPDARRQYESSYARRDAHSSAGGKVSGLTFDIYMTWPLTFAWNAEGLNLNILRTAQNLFARGKMPAYQKYIKASLKLRMSQELFHSRTQFHSSSIFLRFQFYTIHFRTRDLFFVKKSPNSWLLLISKLA